jgi:hypothetical protein
MRVALGERLIFGLEPSLVTGCGCGSNATQPTRAKNADFQFYATVAFVQEYLLR